MKKTARRGTGGMTMRRLKRLPLEKQIFLSLMGVSLTLLLLTVGIMLYRDMDRQMANWDKTIRTTAAYIADLDEVEDMLERGYPDLRLTRQLDTLCEHIEDLNAILICDTAGLRFYYTDRLESGETLLEGDEAAILSGSEPYITTGYGTYGPQRQAFHGVTNEQGEVIGFVVASIFTADILAQNRMLLLYVLLVFAAVALVGLGLSRGMVNVLKKSLRGLHPYELLELYLRKGDILNAIEDGLVATDRQGAVIFSNRAAWELLGLEEDQLRGRPLEEVFPDSQCARVAAAGQPTHNRSCLIGERQVLASEVPILGENGTEGVLSVFHDKTEMYRLSDELSGTKYMLDTLRFFNHEFMNKLHVILGYLQTGEPDKAASFIMNTSLVSSQSIRSTADSIRVSRLCALVIGKMMHAAEQGISLTVAPDSACRQEDLLLPEEDCATIVGNLLENAIEELARGAGEVKEIRLGLYCRPDCNVIVCEDTGGGVPPQLQKRIFEKGVSSKGENRGLGLYLIRQLVDRYRGTIDLVTEAGAGTCFTLTFTHPASEEEQP